MSLTIENGTIVAGAESYATVAELRTYAGKRDETIPADDGDCEVLLRKACDYIQAQEGRFKGDRVSRAQPLAFPRWNLWVNGFYLPSDTIPDDLKAAQMQLAIDAQTLDLQPTIDAAAQQGPVTEETVGPITTRYAEPAVNRTVSWFAKAEGLLAKFCNAGANQIRLTRG